MFNGLNEREKNEVIRRVSRRIRLNNGNLLIGKLIAAEELTKFYGERASGKVQWTEPMTLREIASDVVRLYGFRVRHKMATVLLRVADRLVDGATALNGIARPVVTRRADGAYTAGPPPDGRPVAVHLDELARRPERNREAHSDGPAHASDDLERIRCPNAGQPLHWGCGWCSVHNRPKFECLCKAPLASAPGNGSKFPPWCEDSRCKKPAVHGEHWHDKMRWWCDDHVPMSGHYEHCPDPCRSIVASVSEESPS